MINYPYIRYEDAQKRGILLLRFRSVSKFRKNEMQNVGKMALFLKDINSHVSRSTTGAF